MSRFVLLIEDSEDDAFFFERTVRKSGQPVSLVTCRNGEEAMQYLARAGQLDCPRPDVIFLDLKMPKVDGFEVLHWWRAQPHLADVRVYALSSSTEAHDIAHTRRLGACGYLSKPLTPDLFVRAITCREKAFIGPPIEG
jgi:CheY-like chemotaxis protein